jgi:ribonuclease HI
MREQTEEELGSMTLEELKDQILGKSGTESREGYEMKLTQEINKKTKTSKLAVYFDGSCNPNPKGEMGWGCVIEKHGVVLFEDCDSCWAHEGNSNNVAEYLGLKMALEWILANRDPNEKMLVLGDSNLVVNQMNGEWKIKEGRYRDIAIECQELMRKLPNASFQWIPRHKNQRCDDLSKIKTTKPNS